MAQLFHVGLTVGNLDRSLDYYVNIAGLTLTERFTRQSKAFDDLMSNQEPTIVKVAYLSAGEFTLQLIEYVAGGEGVLALGHAKAGSPHLCFYVDDAVATFTAFRQRGDVNITSAVTQVAPTMLSFYTTDPDGVPVEFLERTEPVPGWTLSVDLD